MGKSISPKVPVSSKARTATSPASPAKVTAKALSPKATAKVLSAKPTAPKASVSSTALASKPPRPPKPMAGTRRKGERWSTVDRDRIEFVEFDVPSEPGRFLAEVRPGKKLHVITLTSAYRPVIFSSLDDAIASLGIPTWYRNDTGWHRIAKEN